MTTLVLEEVFKFGLRNRDCERAWSLAGSYEFVFIGPAVAGLGQSVKIFPRPFAPAASQLCGGGDFAGSLLKFAGEKKGNCG